MFLYNLLLFLQTLINCFDYMTIMSSKQCTMRTNSVLFSQTHNIPLFLVSFTILITFLFEFYHCVILWWVTRYYVANISVTIIDRHHVTLFRLICYIWWRSWWFYWFYVHWYVILSVIMRILCCFFLFFYVSLIYYF